MNKTVADEIKADGQFLIDTEEDLRAQYADTHAIAVKKCLTGLDQYCHEYISRSPFLCLSTQNANGTADVSPRGDPPGFVRILDESTLAIPDRPGNNRLDSLSNIVSNPAVGLLFIVPGFDDTLRVNGSAFLTQEPKLLASQLKLKKPFYIVRKRSAEPNYGNRSIGKIVSNCPL